MAVKDPNVPRPPEKITTHKIGEYTKQDSQKMQSFVKDLAQQVNWPVISSDPTETPDRIPMVKLDTRGWLWLYFDGSWKKYPMNNIAETVTFNGDLNVMENLYVDDQITGGFGAMGTGGTADWNHATNARSGSGYTLLLANATNGPTGSAVYMHAFCFEYGGSKDGTGNLLQLAVPYGDQTGIFFGIWMRGRYNSVWTPWFKVGGTFKSRADNDHVYCRYGAADPNGSWTVWAKELTVYDSYMQSAITLYNIVDERASLSSSGAGGLDTGSEANSTFYYFYVIYNPSTQDVKTMFSTNYHFPTLPSGYTHYQVVDLVYNNSSSNLHYHQRWGDDVWYYTWQQINYNITLTTTWASSAYPPAFPYSWATVVFLYASRISSSAYPRHVVSSYAGPAWMQAAQMSNSGNYVLTNRVFPGFTQMPIYNRGSSIYYRYAFTSGTWGGNTLDVAGYRAPLFRRP